MNEENVQAVALYRRWFLKAPLWGLLLGVPAAHTPTFARADAYPSRPVRIIVPFNPGAAVDVVARMLARGLSEQSGKAVVVENRAGGSSLVGAEAVAKSDPDGLTLLFVPDDTFTILPHLYKKLSFDPNKQLVPIAGIGKIINILVANPTIAPKTLPELIDYARGHPGELRYGSNGFGSAAQLAMETLKAQAKIDILHVPYKGNAPALLGTVSGEVQLMTIGYGTAQGLIGEGKLRPIVVAGSERDPGLPSLPTTAELGYRDVDVTTWLTIAAPGKTPPDIVQQVNDAISRVLKSPEMRKELEARSIVVTDIGPKDVAQGIAHRYQVNGEAVRISGAQLD
jgi:tripartite-type tricarboxylate transporter receptor subunit TctC